MKLDWYNVLMYMWHIALVGGSTYVQVAHPELAPVVIPAIQAAGQVTPPPPGVSIVKQG